jgi:hypothetical protein
MYENNLKSSRRKIFTYIPVFFSQFSGYEFLIPELHDSFAAIAHVY